MFGWEFSVLNYLGVFHDEKNVEEFDTVNKVIKIH